jgi:arabinogalactan oligomer/maltooligosaccharide transport system permease protein
MARSTSTASQAGATAVVSQRSAAREKRSLYTIAAAYTGPAMIGIFIFSVIPILYTLYMSFTNRNTFHFPPAANLFSPSRPGAYTFIGLQNYGTLFWDSTTKTFNVDIFSVLGNTVLYAVVCVGLFFIVGLGLAMLLNSPYIKFKTLFRTLIIVPWAAPAVLTAPIWKFFFNSNFGPIDQILRAAGMSNPPSWLSDPLWSWVGMVIVNLWLSYPFFMFVIMGALTTVPADLYEAARIDGAGWWTQLFRITIPMIRPAVLPVLILSLITTFQMFNTVWIITAGGPFTAIGKPGSTEFVMLYSYHYGLQNNNFGLMSAFAVVLFILLFAVTMLNLRLARVNAKGA